MSKRTYAVKEIEKLQRRVTELAQPLGIGGGALLQTVQHALDGPEHLSKSGALIVRNVISPAQLVANTDNWNPTDLATAEIIRVSTDASRNLTGISAPASGFQALILANVGAFDLVLKHNVTSTAANRLYCPNDADMTLQKDSTAILVYDATTTRWRVIGGGGGGGVTDHGALTGLGDDDHTQYALDTDLSTHSGAVDPHTVYILESLGDDKGDLIGFSADNTPVKVPKAASDGLTLISDAAATGGVKWDVPSTSLTGEIIVVVDNGSAVVTTGYKGEVRVPFPLQITGWYLTADQSTTAVMDVWKDVDANFPPTVADTITGSEKPTLTAVRKNQDLTLTTWAGSPVGICATGDWLAFNVDSNNNALRLTLHLLYTRTA